MARNLLQAEGWQESPSSRAVADGARPPVAIDSTPNTYSLPPDMPLRACALLRSKAGPHALGQMGKTSRSSGSAPPVLLALRQATETLDLVIYGALPRSLVTRPVCRRGPQRASPWRTTAPCCGCEAAQARSATSWVLGSEIGGPWNEVVLRFDKDLERIRAQRAPQALRTAATFAWTRQWRAILTVALQLAVSSTALGSQWLAPLHASQLPGFGASKRTSTHHRALLFVPLLLDIMIDVVDPDAWASERSS